MALQLENGTYVTIEQATDQQVAIRIHKDAQHRERYKAQTEDEFETTKLEGRNVEVDLTVNADAEKSIRDNIISAGYTALKASEEFINATDV